MSSYWNEWWHDACWCLTTSTCTTSTTVTGCVLNSGDYCEPGPAKIAVYGADGCAGHADFEAVAALGGTTVAEARKKFTNYCLPSQEWQYDCRQSDAGSLTCPIDQQSCDGGCDDGTTGSTDDQCNQCLSDGHEGLDGGATCDGSCTPGDVSDPCFKGFTHSPPPPPSTANTTSPPPPPSTANTTSPPPPAPPPPAPPPPKLILDEDDHAAGLTGILVALVATIFNML